MNLLIIILMLSVVAFVGSLTAPALMLEEVDKGTLHALLTLVPARVIVMATTDVKPTRTQAADAMSG